MTTPRVIFANVKTPREKLASLCQTVQKCFEQKQRVLIAVSDQAVARYVDQLLWRLPEESFLPHCVATQPTQALVAITPSQQNVNQASILWNLCPEVSPIWEQFQVIYELFDQTDAQKEQMSTQRKAHYTHHKCLIRK